MSYVETSNEWITLCPQSELRSGEMRGFDVDGFPPVALFNVGGCIHATSNVCTHNVAILTDGSFDGQIVECPLHGGSFDVTTGAAVSYPCEKSIEKFQVQVIDKHISVARMVQGRVATFMETSATKGAETSPRKRADTPVEVQIEGSSNRYTCEPGDTMLRAALRSNIGFPYECNSGGCGSCMYRLVSGEIHDAWPDAPGLSASARVAGNRLACQSMPLSNCVIRTRERPEFVAPIKPSKRSVTLENVTHLTHDMAIFRLRGEGAANFLPGQYAMLSSTSEPLERAYSMSNTANDDGVWEFVVKEVPGGRFSSRMATLEHLVDALTLDGPYGNAYLCVDSTRPVLCIAGGAGLSPMLSILRGAVQEDGFSDRPLSLFYGGRTPHDLCDALILEADEQLRERVEWINAISDNTASCANWTGPRGFIHDVVKAHLGAGLQEYEIYLSGPPLMTDAVQRMLVIEYRVPASQIHFDRFC